ncbi:MAG: hypothetical protein SF066_11355 [Thermoanaerobaculia bacterium]|nr:hypothetical protein [Thermoanaerobaculia bacterium]
MATIYTEVVTDTLKSGVSTTDMLDSQPPALRVSWLRWDSGFRGTGLTIGDRIVAVDGVALAPFASQQEMQKHKPLLFGQFLEANHWAARGAKEDDPVRLTVRRRRMPGEGWETHEIVGRLRAERMFHDDRGRQAFGPKGPNRLERDGFDDAWLGWYDRRIWDWERLVDNGVWDTRRDNRQLLASHLADEPRVRFLAEHYPGAFAEAVVEDWEMVRVLLSGRRYEIAAEELTYRVAEEKRLAEVTAAARAAWLAFQAARAHEIGEVPANFDPFKSDPAEVAGRLIALPVADVRSWVQDFGRAYVSWNERGTWFFCPLDSPALGRVWDAQVRYKRNVAPRLDDDMAMVVRLLPERKLVSVRGWGGVAGLEVEPVAVLLGRSDRQIFVDLTIEREGVSPFAGEDAIAPLPSALPPDDASPRQVLEALFAALYARDMATWFALFADWRLVHYSNQPFYYPYYPYPEVSKNGDWTRSRRVILEKSYALRIVWIGDPRVVAEGGEVPGLPRIERVEAEIEHVGLFDGEYRAFNSVEVHRHWTLERRAGGPWRFTTHQGI